MTNLNNRSGFRVLGSHCHALEDFWGMLIGMYLVDWVPLNFLIYVGLPPSAPKIPDLIEPL